MLQNTLFVEMLFGAHKQTETTAKIQDWSIKETEMSSFIQTTKAFGAQRPTNLAFVAMNTLCNTTVISFFTIKTNQFGTQ
jgi:hypothetical protein